MDVYLPADFYRLRDDLRDWRGESASNPQQSRTLEQENAAYGVESRNACADPLWRVI